MDLHRWRGLAAAMVALGCVGSSPVCAGTLEGTPTYRARIALPPFRVQIVYDDAAVQPLRCYGVRATVRHLGGLFFTTDRAYPMLAGGAEAPLQLLLVSAGGGTRPSPRAGANPAPSELPASYEGELRGGGGVAVLWQLDLLPQGRFQLRTTHKDRPEPNRFDDIGRWRREPDTGRLLLRGGREAPIALMPSEDGRTLRTPDGAGELQRLPQPALIEPRLTLTGMFTYMADAATIVLCADGARLPVAMEGDYKALETAYLKERRQPGEALLASLDGLIARRPSMEASRPPRPSLVVERFIRMRRRETCGNRLADSPLRNTYWKLVRLSDAPVQVAVNQREPHLILAHDQPRVTGSGGCDRLIGRFELDDGDALRFRGMAGTMMACPAGMEQEQRLRGR